MANVIYLLLWVTLLCTSTKFGVQSSKVLFNLGQGSHYLAATALAEELVTRGHTVTILLSDTEGAFRASDPDQIELFSFIIYNAPISPAEETRMVEILETSMFERGWKLAAYSQLAAKRIQRHCKNFLDEKMMKQLIDERFDLVISDPSAGMPCDDGLGKYLGVPKGYIMTGSLFPGYLRQTGLRLNPAFTAEVGLGFPPQMSFPQRVFNVVYSGIFSAYLSVFLGDTSWQTSNTTERSDDPVRLADFVILSVDPLIGRAISLPPGYIPAAGLTTRPAKRLEKHLEDFMQSSGNHGVIIFTIGNAVSYLPEYLVEAFRDAFSKLPQKVIWQWKNKKPMEDAPGNVMTLDWLPQNDLLGHNKTRLFIYQGGNNGLFEAIYHGIPLVVMPLDFDQPDVAQIVVEREIGLRLRIPEVASGSLSQCINEVLTDKKYQTNMKRLSTMFRDRVQTPKEKAATFVEHVLKYGVEHLRPPGGDMSFIQFYLIDVIGFLLLCTAFAILITCLTMKYTVRLLISLAISRKDKRD